MTTSEIKPRTLIAVLAAHIRDEADAIARNIVDQAKSSDVEYSTLVEQFVLQKSKVENITFSSFSHKAFDEIRDTDMLLDFSIELKTSYRKSEKEVGVFECRGDNLFSIECTLDHKSDPDRWGKDSVMAYGTNAHHVFESFKARLASKLADIAGKKTEVELQSKSE